MLGLIKHTDTMKNSTRSMIYQYMVYSTGLISLRDGQNYDTRMFFLSRDTPATALKSGSAERVYQKRKPRISSIRPYSPVFSNISYPNLDCR